jgi:hypothetical protein
MKPAQVPKQFLLPDLFPITPFKSGINPHYRQVAAESSAWITSFELFSRNKRVVPSLGHSELLSAHVYPCVFHSYALLFTPILLYPTIRYASQEQLRTACDFVRLIFLESFISTSQPKTQINLLFVLDEISDDQDGKGALKTGNLFLSAMENPSIESHSDNITAITKECVYLAPMFLSSHL